MRYLLKVFQFEPLPLNQNQPMEIDVQDLDHLGLIAGIVDEIGIVEIINRLLGTHPLEEISAGYVVKSGKPPSQKFMWPMPLSTTKRTSKR